MVLPSSAALWVGFLVIFIVQGSPVTDYVHHPGSVEPGILPSLNAANCRKQLIRNATMHKLTHQIEDKTGSVRFFFAERNGAKFPFSWSPFIPVYTCPDEERVGNWLDGGKWICGVSRLPKPCVIYSIGSSGEDSFERGMKKLAPQCDIHTFDPGEYAHRVAHPHVLTYHRVALGTTHNPGGGTTTIQQIMNELKHSHIDILKIDIEGAEFPILPTLFGPRASPFPVSIGQLQIEVHGFNGHPNGPGGSQEMFFTMRDILNNLYDAGLHMFHIEPNPWGTWVVEMAFVNISTLPPALRPRCTPEGPRDYPSPSKPRSQPLQQRATLLDDSDDIQQRRQPKVLLSRVSAPHDGAIVRRFDPNQFLTIVALVASFVAVYVACRKRK